MSGLGVGVIGLGVGWQHLTAFQGHGACRVVVVCDYSQERLDEAKRLVPGASLTEAAQEVLSHPDVDVVSIASYDQDHHLQTLKALEARKHVFVEKPLCRTLEEARALKEAWRAAGHPQLISNLVLRAAPLYRWLRDAIADGVLGQVYAVDGDYLYGRLEKMTEGWRGRVEGYSVMQGGGIHLVDLIMWLTGQKPSAVAASGNRICTEGTAFAYQDFQAAQFRFPTGLVGRVSANFGCVHRHQHVLRVFGSRATFVYDDVGPRLFESRDPGTAGRRLELAPLPASKGALIPEFVEGLLSRRDTRSLTQHELDLVSVCAAADRATQERGFMDIEYA
jgi:predicted dehydrogenase